MCGTNADISSLSGRGSLAVDGGQAILGAAAEPKEPGAAVDPQRLGATGQKVAALGHRELPLPPRLVCRQRGPRAAVDEVAELVPTRRALPAVLIRVGVVVEELVVGVAFFAGRGWTLQAGRGDVTGRRGAAGALAAGYGAVAVLFHGAGD